ncbi:MAG: hypothetical protein MRY83_18300 [Flavobacteriales bacterium]|nr:hypothetical protein [Flavobacteriales bacterium]
MAKAANFKINGLEFTGSIDKVDRKKIYGYSKVEVRDESGGICSLASVSPDGSHLLPSGCTGIININENGHYISRSDMLVVDKDNKLVDKVPSTFELDCVELQEVKDISEYLSLNVKSIYQLNIEDETKKQELIAYLKEVNLLYFMFNYRADYDGDDAYLLENEGYVFAVIGKKAQFEFLGFENQVEEEVEMDEEEEEAEFDFSML